MRDYEDRQADPERNLIEIGFWNKPYEATTTIEELDFARTNTDESQKPKINFVEIPSSSSGGGN